MYERTQSPKYICVSGIVEPEYGVEYTDLLIQLGIHERASVALTVSNEYKEIFKKMKEYIEKENLEIKDDTLKQEIDLLTV